MKTDHEEAVERLNLLSRIILSTVMLCHHLNISFCTRLGNSTLWTSEVQWASWSWQHQWELSTALGESVWFVCLSVCLSVSLSLSLSLSLSVPKDTVASGYFDWKSCKPASACSLLWTTVYSGWYLPLMLTRISHVFSILLNKILTCGYTRKLSLLSLMMPAPPPPTHTD